MWQLWRPTRQKWADTVARVETNARDRNGLTLASVETKATETEGETETRPSPFFSRGRPGGEYTANRKETIANQNVEYFTYAVPHISSIRLDLNTLRLGLFQRLAALFSPRQCL